MLTSIVARHYSQLNRKNRKNKGIPYAGAEEHPGNYRHTNGKRVEERGEVSLSLYSAMVTISKPPLLALAVIMILMVTHPSSVSSSQRLASSAVLQLIGRVLPGREREFAVTIDSDANKLDTFEFYTVNKTFLQISATTGVAAAWGFNHYLKYFCKAHISWSGSQLLVPTPLPIVEKVVKISSPNRLDI